MRLIIIKAHKKHTQERKSTSRFYPIAQQDDSQLSYVYYLLQQCKQNKTKISQLRKVMNQKNDYVKRMKPFPEKHHYYL